jgi:Luciferase-like monooxygenase
VTYGEKHRDIWREAMIQEIRVGIVDTRAPADAGAEMVVPHNLGLAGKTTALQATTQSLAVSVLDLVATRAGESAGSAIAQTVELARHVEQLGYKRYWVAEHHSIPGLA